MRRSHWIAASIVLGIALSLTIYGRQSEPNYYGKPLTFWLRSFESDLPQIHRQSAEAVRRIGTNALPLIVQMLETKPPIQESWWRQKRRPLLSLVKINLPRPAIARREALAALDALGPTVKDAVPVLEKLLHQNPPDPRAVLVEALWPVGSNSADKRLKKINGIDCLKLRHDQLLYSLRNKRVHESGTYGTANPLSYQNNPYYHRTISLDTGAQWWTLNYPSSFVENLAANMLNGLDKYYRINMVDPYDFFDHGDYWFTELKIGLGQTFCLGLLYYEPVTELEGADSDFLIKSDRFFLEFSPKLKSVKLETEAIHPLLRRVREICDLPECPAGRPDCPDCSMLEELVSAAGQIAALTPFLKALILGAVSSLPKRQFD